MALTKIQELILQEFAKSSLRNRFYWSGGTLLAEAYLHHRQSYDIDFFSPAPFAHKELIHFVERIRKKTKLRFIEEKKVFDRWEFFLHNQEEIRIEFVYYDFPALKPRKKILTSALGHPTH